MRRTRRVEKVSPREFGVQRQRALQYHAGALHVAFLYRHSPQVHPAVRVCRVRLGDVLKCGRRSLQVALQE